MKKAIVFILCVFMSLGLFACKAGNDMFKAASPETSVLSFYYYDDLEGWTGWIYSIPDQQEIIEMLSDVAAKKVEDISDIEVTLPIYGLEMGSDDGMGILASWSNGYLYLRDGSVYEFDFDFEKLKVGYNWENRSEIISASGMPCGYYLTKNQNGWNKQLLSESKEFDEPKGLTMEIMSIKEDVIKVQISNGSGKSTVYGTSFAVQAKIDGVWYDIPAEPSNNWGFTSIAMELADGGTANEDIYIKMYGELPKGEYRIVKENLTAQFTK